MTWVFLDVEAVLNIHHEQIASFGGSHGLRDQGLLESAVARAENKANYDPEATIASVAASLSWGLIKNHAFIDGNKRIGLATLAAFLKLNGFWITSSSDEQVAAVLQVAAGAMSEADWNLWVLRNITPAS